MSRFGSSGSKGDGIPYGWGEHDIPMGEAAQRECYETDSEFGLPDGYVDPDQYHGKTPEQSPNVHVSRDRRY